MNKNRIRGIRCRTSGQMTTKSISIKGTGCKSGGCVREGGRTYLGRSAVCPGIRTEGRVIDPDRAAEVSRGHSRHASAEGPNGPRKGLMGAASKQRNS